MRFYIKDKRGDDNERTEKNLWAAFGWVGIDSGQLDRGDECGRTALSNRVIVTEIGGGEKLRLKALSLCPSIAALMMNSFGFA